jgi:endoglucanase
MTVEGQTATGAKVMKRGTWHPVLDGLAILVAFSAVSLHVAAAFGEAPREDRHKTPSAFEQNNRLGRGVNILGYDPIWKSRAEARFQAENFRLIRQAGFDHVRINLHPFRDAGAGAVLGATYTDALDWTVKQARENRLAAVLDFHEFLEMARNPTSKKARLLAVWREIAERYKNEPRDVYFEILNEPNGELTPALWNRLLREALAVIRSTNPTRTVIVGPGHWNNIDMLEELDLPAEDRNIIVTVHYYDPFAFTHQGAPWTEYKNKTGVAWRGDDGDRRSIARDFRRVQAWAKKHDRPIYLGEFGVFDTAETRWRVRYLDAVARQAEKLGWSWAHWQFDGNFSVYDAQRGQWFRPILDALIPPASH